MPIDITRLLIHNVEMISVDEIVQIPNEYLKDSLIKELQNVRFKGDIVINEEENVVLTGILSGTMILPDDITLEPVTYKFTTEIEEILDNVEKTLDIINILWQNILVEIPSKVRGTNEDVSLEGNGWRVISEDKYNEERTKANNPFSNLDELLKKKEDR